MRFALRLAAATMAIALLLSSSVPAQSPFVDDVVLEPEATPQNVQITLAPAQFDSYLRLPSRTQSPSSTPLKTHLKNQLALRISQVHAACKLTAEQRAKLQLAGQGDIVRMLHDVEELREKYVDRPFPREELVAAQAEIFRRGTARVVHPFTERSLFVKVLRRQLSDVQYARYAEMDRARRIVDIRVAITTFTQNAQLTQDVTQKKLAALVAEKFPTWRPSGPYSQLVAMQIMSELKDDLQPLVNDQQWQVIVKLCESANRHEPRLRTMGLWPIEPDEDGLAP